MHSIAIIVGDNDFGSTFRALLETIHEVVVYSVDDLPEDVLIKIIKHGVKFHYIAFQNRYDYLNQAESFEAHFNSTEKYLDVKVLFDEEADGAYLNEDHDHGAWHLHIETCEINSF